MADLIISVLAVVDYLRIMLSIHGTIGATCAQRVIVSFLELGLVEGEDFQMVEIGDLSKIKSPEWLEKQPFGQMPYVVDEETGAVIYESRAIVRSKLAPHSPLLPYPNSDLVAYAKFETGASVEAANFDPYVKALFWELFGKSLQGGQTDLAKVDEANDGLQKSLAGYERILSKQDWIGGDRLTLVDLWHLPFASFAVSGLIDGAFPRVAAWWQKLNELESWKAVDAKRQVFYAARRK